MTHNTLRYIVITQEDPIYIGLFFVEFANIFKSRKLPGELAGAYILPAFNESKVDLARRMYNLYGPIDFVRLLTRYGRLKIGRKLAQMGLSEKRYDISEICRKAGIPVSHIENVNKEAFVKLIEEQKIDLVISISAPQIFKKKLLEAPRIGCINIHNGRLPDYRGMLPNFWQLYNGETSSTMTIHTMEESLDTGEILAEVETPISPGMALDALIRETKAKSAHVLANVLQAYSERSIKPIRVIKKSEGQYYTFPKRQHARELRRAGFRLL